MSRKVETDARLKGVAQIKDDIIVHEKGREYDERLGAVFKRRMKYNITLGLDKCHLWGIKGSSGSVKFTSSSACHLILRRWKQSRPQEKTEVKSFR